MYQEATVFLKQGLKHKNRAPALKIELYVCAPQTPMV